MHREKRDIPQGRAEMRRRLRDYGRARTHMRELERAARAAARDYDELAADVAAARRRLNAKDMPDADQAALKLALRALSDCAARYAAAAQAARERMFAQERMYAGMTAAISRLSPREQRIISLRYQRRLSWTAIGQQTYNSPTTVRLCERMAVDKLARMLDIK